MVQFFAIRLGVYIVLFKRRAICLRILRKAVATQVYTITTND